MYACLYLPPHSHSHSMTRPASDVTQALVHLAHEYSPRIELQGQQLVVLDIHGMKRLRGSPREIGATLRRTAADRGLMIRVAVASTRMAALLVTQGRSGLTVIPPGSEAVVLAALPLSTLKQLAQAQASGSSARGVGKMRRARRNVASATPTSLVLPALMLLPVVQRWGLKTLGDLAALPTDQLCGRLGAGGVELQRIARGEDSRPLVPTLSEDRFEQTLALEWPIEGLEPLSFVLGRVLEPLCARLEQRGVGAGTLHVRLTLVSRDTHDRVLQFPVPLRDPRALRTLIVLDLESHPPSAGVDRVTVRADPVPARVLQHSLLERAVPSPEHLSTLLARLSVLMGDKRCGAPGVIDSHRPGAFELLTFRPRPVPSAQTDPHTLVPILRRFRVPVTARVSVERGRPVRVITGHQRWGGGRIVASAGPWRSSGHWWGTADHIARNETHAWDRDEWDVALNDGGMYRIFRDRVSNRWFVEGMVD